MVDIGRMGRDRTYRSNPQSMLREIYETYKPISVCRPVWILI